MEYVGHNLFWSLNDADWRPVGSCLYSLSDASQSIDTKVSSDQWCFSVKYFDMIGV